jgi:ABC-type transport system involved in multi-copper enzyme maturation permease subunit
MPIYDKGYRRYEGNRRSRFYRWWTVAREGVRLTARGKWLRRFVLIAWLPLLYYAFVFFVVGRMTDAATLEKAKAMWQFEIMRGMFGGPLTEEFIRNPGSFRPMIWSLLVHFFMHYTQIFSVMIVVAIIGPKLVAEDLTSRALDVYFSRPLTRLDYLLGKFAVASFWIGMVTLLPALFLYLVSIAFSPSFQTVAQTIGILPKIAAFSLFLMLGCGLPMLALSSLVGSPRFLSFLWAGFWVLTYVASRILSLTMFPPFRTVGRGPPVPAEGNWTGLLSYSSNLDAVGFRLFDLEALMRPAAEASPQAGFLLARLSYGHSWVWSLLIVLGLAAVSVWVVFRRTRAPDEA